MNKGDVEAARAEGKESDKARSEGAQRVRATTGVPCRRHIPPASSYLFVVYEHGSLETVGGPLEKVCRLLRSHVNQHTFSHQEGGQSKRRKKKKKTHKYFFSKMGPSDCTQVAALAGQFMPLGKPQVLVFTLTQVCHDPRFYTVANQQSCWWKSLNMRQAMKMAPNSSPVSTLGSRETGDAPTQEWGLFPFPWNLG